MEKTKTGRREREGGEKIEKESEREHLIEEHVHRVDAGAGIWRVADGKQQVH